MTDVPPSERVVEAVAREEGCHPLELPPLYDAVDPNALDELFARRNAGSVTVRYCGYDVTVTGDGTPVVRPGGTAGVTSC